MEELRRKSTIARSSDSQEEEKLLRRQQKASWSKTEMADDLRVIDLCDEKSKVSLKRQLELESSEEPAANADEEMLLNLPAETVVIRQEKYKEDSDYVRDSTETSSGSSSTSGGGPKVRRLQRAVRNKNRSVEIRRNPIRAKKDVDKPFPRPRQRLLSAKRRETLFADSGPVKRVKSSTMPYMNTRSVTRKMYNVGATYQAPTKKDETEWKEWPVHGMHERPVYHQQFGLAAEYVGKFFISLDGFSYQEIIDPEIEVVSVDPNCESAPSSNERKPSRTTKPSDLSREGNFETCMHDSLHCVLSYCSQVSNPAFKMALGDKLTKLKKEEGASKSGEKTHVDLKPHLQGGKPPRFFPAKKVYVAKQGIPFTNLKTLQGGKMIVLNAAEPKNRPGNSLKVKEIVTENLDTSSRLKSLSSDEWFEREAANASPRTWRVGETSEIARILSEYNESAKRSATEAAASAQPTLPTASDNVAKSPQKKWRRFHFTVEKLRNSTPTERKEACEVANETGQMSHDLLQELLENTAVLYCAATGTCQDDLASYIDSLDGRQSLQWMANYMNSAD